MKLFGKFHKGVLRWLLLCFLIVGFICINWLKQTPELVESFYSQQLYPLIFSISNFLFGWVQFSFGDLLLLFIIVGVPFGIVWTYKSLRRKKYLSSTLSLLNLGLFAYCLFYFCWGLNYFRVPLNQKLGYELTYDEVELHNTLKEIIYNINLNHHSLVTHDTLPVEYPFLEKEINSMIKQGIFLSADLVHPKGSSQSVYVKKSLWSLPLSYMGFAGYLNPITLETQVNGLMIPTSYITTAIHEITHQLGIAAENEANYLAYRMSVENSNRYIKYSGYLLGLMYCVSEYYKVNPESAKILYSQLNPGIHKNIKQTREFWNKYDNPFEYLFEKSYDTYLKAQGQKQGIESYNQMVAYLIEYHQEP